MGGITTWEPASPRQPVVWSTRSEAGADGESPDGRGRRPRPTVPAAPSPRRPASRPSRGEPERETERNWWPQTPSSCAGRWPRATPPGGAPRPTRGSARGRARRRGRRRGRDPAARRRPRRDRGPARRRRPGPRRHRLHHPRAVLAPGPHPAVRRSRSPTPASPGWSWRCADPDPQVAGQGIAQLRDRGITVDVGVGADDAARALAPYLAPPPPRPCLHGGEDRHEPRRPHRGPRRLVAVDHRRRRRAPTPTRCAPTRRPSSSARAPRSPTARASPPATCDPPVARQPLRVLLDATGRVAADGPLFDAALAPTLVVTTDAAPDGAQQAWLAAGAKVLTVPPAASGTGRRPRRHPRGARRPRGAPGAGRGGRRALGLAGRGRARRPARHLRGADHARARRAARARPRRPRPHRRRAPLAAGRRRPRRHRRPPRLRAARATRTDGAA